VLGSMDPSAKANSATEAIHYQQPSVNESMKKIQNENIEPNNANQQQQTTVSKSFYGNTTTAAKEMPIQKASAMNANTTMTATGGAGTFNGFKILGISSLNPYQNKLECFNAKYLLLLQFFLIFLPNPKL
jgi:hypothetical protein